MIVQHGYLELVGLSMECTRRIWCHIDEVALLKAKDLSGHSLHTAHLLWSLSSSLSLKYFHISDLDLDGT